MRNFVAAFALLFAAACGGVTTDGSGTKEPGTPDTPSSSSASSSPSESSTPSSEPHPNCNMQCVDDEVTWRSDGGLVMYVETSSVTPCNHYSVVRSGDDGESTCSTDLVQGCESPDGLLGTSELNAALAHPDVKKALNNSPAVYGKDDRPCDGSVLRISIGKSTFSVGGDCKAGEKSCGGGECSPVPPGLRTLSTLLAKLAEQEKSRPSRVCTQ